ncbi:peptidase C15, pyroglutamyl peptidase I-like protein [Schizopora paradoxa]|uniref:Peptidase C15, pyroglutamyl peptidase I-like protein n=1 Tax=Schizopora paradoxa TaxID=27342 RepID=A0A0H2SG87_9AGAM|nr:peptidase C15, pyroglutamyl peptidase I-like protein [Schizopora paradoxa]
MPSVPLVVPGDKNKDVIRVLATGFGKFRGYETKENPSWLAVSQLHNLVLEPDESTKPVTLSQREVLDAGVGEGDGRRSKRLEKPIHITALKMPVTYEAVLSSVPGFHARPPVLALPPGSDSTYDLSLSGPPPPDDGYDFILHVGVGRRGGLKIEQLGHKYGYYQADADGKLAPIVPSEEDAPGDGDEQRSSDDRNAKKIEATMERSRKADDLKKHLLNNNVRPEDFGADANENILFFNGQARLVTKREPKVERGFAKGYEVFADELHTDIDTHALVDHLHEQDYKLVQPSNDAGRYLCDFIYYCSLAEQKRAQQTRDGVGKKTKVLFVHCPPVGEQLSVDEVIDGLKRIIVWVTKDEAGKK